MVKPYASHRATRIFSETKIKITNEGYRYLGGTFGTEEFKVLEWINQLEVLIKIAAIEPHAAYCAFVGGFKHKVTYTIRTFPNWIKL